MLLPTLVEHLAKVLTTCCWALKRQLTDLASPKNSIDHSKTGYLEWKFAFFTVFTWNWLVLAWTIPLPHSEGWELPLWVSYRSVLERTILPAPGQGTELEAYEDKLFMIVHSEQPLFTIVHCQQSLFTTINKPVSSTMIGGSCSNNIVTTIALCRNRTAIDQTKVFHTLKLDKTRYQSQLTR